MNPNPHWIVWLAQGMGIGRIPFAPGTWGSVLGLLWFMLIVPRGEGVYFGCMLLSALVAIPICGAAARLLGEKDPSSVVLDEVVATPACFVTYLLAFSYIDSNPYVRFISQNDFLASALIFALFRLFDIWKPWPIRQSQRLPGGWGVVMDDVLAAVYVNLVMLAAWGVMRWLD